MDVKEIKKKADAAINTKVKVPIIGTQGAITLTELEVSKNKVLNKTMVLSSFKDTSFVCNALLYLEKFPYEVLENTDIVKA